MTERAADVYKPENDPEVMKYRMRQGPRTAAFLLVIPGCAIIGCGVGLLVSHPLPPTLIGFGTGLFTWGLIVALGR